MTFSRQLFFVENRAHSAPAAAPAGFEHQREADCAGLGEDEPSISLAQNLGGRDHRHAASMATRRALALSPRARMVAAFGADEGDAGGVAGIDEIGVFRQQAIARMDGVGPRSARDADDFVEC